MSQKFCTLKEWNFFGPYLIPKSKHKKYLSKGVINVHSLKYSASNGIAQIPE